MLNNFEDLQKQGKDNVELALKSFGALSKGLQAIAVEVADHSKQSFEEGTAVVEQLLGCKTLDKAIEVQSGFAKNAYEAYVARLTKIGELVADTAKEASKPYEGIARNAGAQARGAAAKAASAAR